MDSESDLLGIDATKPEQEYSAAGAEFPLESEPPEEWTERVRDRWDEYGLLDLHR